MNKQEKNQWIAEKVYHNEYPHDHCQYSGVFTTDDRGVLHVSCNKCGMTQLFLLHGDLNHAEKALVQFNSVGPRMWRSSGYWYVMIMGRDTHYKDRYQSHNKSLSAAITEALCLATGYKEVSG